MNPNKRIKLRTGDHLVTPRTGYTHHGLYIGDGTVIHYLQDGVCLATLKDFCDGATYHVKDTPRRYSRDKCVERAYSRIGEDDYNLLFNNCESFVNWCLNGLPISEQVTSFGDTVIKAVELTRPTKVPLSDCNYRTPPTTGPTVPMPDTLAKVVPVLSAAFAAVEVFNVLANDKPVGEAVKDFAVNTAELAATVVIADAITKVATPVFARSLGGAIPGVAVGLATYTVASAIINHGFTGAALEAVVDDVGDMFGSAIDVAFDIGSGIGTVVEGTGSILYDFVTFDWW